ncbi:MAG: IS66 family insertion sequence element accessory protein TnpB [bacterium]|nr:IS66 family insertion sequence element accessory protein TnpB [bacterium]
MIGSTRAIRVFARAQPTDLRNGFDGLYGIVRSEFDHELLDGDFFLFVNKRRKSARVLHWDGTGLCIYSKRLSQGRFAKLWGAQPGQPVELSRSELALFIEGAKLADKLPLSPPKYRH